MSILIVMGISGAGKTTVSDTLEDIGYNCIDNLPAALLPAVSRIEGETDMAIVVDTKGAAQLNDIHDALKQLSADGVNYSLLFLNCDKDVILKRYKYNRRPHPLMGKDGCTTIEQAIEKEIELSKSLLEIADKVIDTTFLTNKQLRKTVVDTFKQIGYKPITVKFISFGYKNGLPAEADLVYDVRCVPNPYYLEALRELSGLDDEVYNYVFSFEQSNKLADLMYDYLVYSLPYYIEEGKNELIIALGCTSGHHRSVSFARKLAEKIDDGKYNVVVVHRDVTKEFEHNK